MINSNIKEQHIKVKVWFRVVLKKLLTKKCQNNNKNKLEPNLENSLK
jgi:hypothetical protein